MMTENLRIDEVVKESLVFLMLSLTLTASDAGRSGQTSSPTARQPVPSQSWTCPMHPDVVEDKPGICPICKMKLEPVRLDSAWSCPIHVTVVETRAGACPVCRRQLVPITVSVFWTCPESAAHEMSPGRCPDGSERVVARERRPHGDHNPRHGGVFFMAPDNWHHLEGTYPRAGVFRLFVYDDYTRPLPLAAVTGRAVTKTVFDPDRKQWREIEAYTLRRSRNNAYLEARMPSAGLPAQIAAKIRFTADGEEYPFDFTFPSYSKEPAHGAPPVTTTTATTTTTPTPTSVPAAATADMPDTTAGLLTELRAQSRQVETLRAQGAFAQIYVPAMSTKELALALEARSRELPDDRRRRVASAVRRVVLAAWLVDWYADLGNGEKLTDACHAFAAAVEDLTAAYATAR